MKFLRGVRLTYVEFEHIKYMTTTSVKSVDWQALIASLAGVETITDPTQVAKISQDYHTFSPIL